MLKNLKNVNLEGLSEQLKLSKKEFKKGALTLGLSLLIGTSVVGCSKKTNEVSSNVDTIVTTEVDTEAVTEKETETEESKEITIEKFNQLVDEVLEENKKVELGIRKEDIELAVYMSNINNASSELVSYIEGRYEGNEENMIMIYFDVISNYLNSKTKYYNGKTEKLASASVLFQDDIDKETIITIEEMYDELVEELKNPELKKEEKQEKYDEWFETIHEYIMYSGNIAGYMKETLNPGAFMTTKVMIDSQLSFLRAGITVTSSDKSVKLYYGNDSELPKIMNANADYMISQLYKALESKQQIGECETEKVNTLK